MGKSTVIISAAAIGALVGAVAIHMQSTQQEPDPDPIIPEAIPEASSQSSIHSSVMPEEDLEMKLMRAEAKNRELEAELALVREAEPAPQPQPTEEEPEASPAKDMLEAIGGMLKDPGMKDMLVAQQKAQMEATHGALLEYLQLTPEEQEAFMELQVGKTMALMDAGLSLIGKSESPDAHVEAGNRVSEINEEYNKKIRTLLGEEDYATYEEFEETQPDRMQVDAFKQGLRGDNQLTEEQEHKLIVAMHEERTQFTFSGGLGQQESFDPSQLTEETLTSQMAEFEKLNQRYIERAGGILSEPQLEQFQGTLEKQRAMQEMGLKMAVQMFAAPGSGQEK